MATIKILNHRPQPMLLWMALVDAVLFWLALYACSLLHSLYPSTGLLAGFPAEAALFAAVLMFGQYAVGLYAPRMREDVKGVLLRAISSFVIAFLVLAIIFVALLESDLNRTTYALAAAFAFGATLINRIFFNRILNRERFKRRVLVYGVGEAASAISDTMRRRSDRRNFTIVGFVGAGDEPTRPQSERITNPQHPLA